MNFLGPRALGESTALVGVHAMFPTPFGLHTRYMLAAYLRGTLLVLVSVLVVALSIDLSRYLTNVLAADSSKTALGHALILGWYVAMLSTDRIAEFLPFACFFGVLWAEVRHTISQERLIGLITGRAPLQCLAPLILFAVLMGAVELALIMYLRPVAVMEQTDAHLGMYGEIFDRSPTPERKWFITGGNIVLTNIEFTLPPVLRDIRLFKMDDEHRLSEVIDAAYATSIDGNGNWLFHDGRSWTVKSRNLDEVKFTQEAIALDIDPLRLRYSGISAKYLPNEVFRSFDGATFDLDADYRTWAQARYSVPVGTIGMAILAGTLSLMLLVNGIRLVALSVIICTGYACHLFFQSISIAWCPWLD